MRSVSISRSHCGRKKRGLTLPQLLRGAHFWWGQFEHSVTRRPVPRVQLLSRTSVSLTLLPHWQVLVFGAAAAGGVCSSGWGSSSRCLFWPIVGEGGVWGLIVGAFLGFCFRCVSPYTRRSISIFRFHCGGKNTRSHCASAYLSLFLTIPAALVAIPVSFTVGGIFHAVGESADALPHCSVTERQFRIWVTALCRWQAHAHQNASLVLRQGC